jgi:aspartyl protease family protein
MPIDLAPAGLTPTLVAIVGAILLVSIVARRIPVLRTVFALLTWAALAGVLLFVVAERERFDPYVGRIASALDLDRQRVEGGETRVPMARDGHFYVQAEIAGVRRRMLVDSGATVTALSVGTVAAAGLPLRATPFPMLIRTANGTIRADTAALPELRMGNIVARDLSVVVSPAFGNADILGMNFLSRLKSWRVEGRTLILVPHHPQPI